MEAKYSGTSSFATTLSWAAASTPYSPPTAKSPPQLAPWPESSPGEDLHGSALRVVSLNLGGRNTNPVEFEVKGDNSETAAEATAILRRAGKAMKSAQEGPLLMPESEMKVVHAILARIFNESVEEARCEWHSRMLNLLRCETWAQVHALVQASAPYLFNTLNLYTLKLNRPSVWENPASCKGFSNTKEYLLAWEQWYTGLDSAGKFWLEDAPRAANKRGLEVPAAFAGLLLFDLMSLCTARFATQSGEKDDDLDDISEDSREVPFKKIARLAESLPSSNLTARHAFAQTITQGAHALLAQEARSFADHPTMAEEFLPPFCAADGFTAVFLRKGSFTEATDISAAVARRMEEAADAGASQEAQRAWRTTASRLAAALCESRPELGGFRVCLVSLHASRSECTAEFVQALRETLADYDADINVVGMDSNCAAKEVSRFQKALWNAGFEIGCTPKQQQVTVAKQRTAFQTQIRKVGEVDISHKDYILTWMSPRVRRGRTTYTPDLRTSYAVEQETKQCVRLPMTKWPFDHTSVATSFQRKSTLKDSVRCSSRHSCCVWVMIMLVVLVLVSPSLSVERDGPYGKPGLWFHDGFIAEPRFGICEAAAPCPLGDWVQAGSSCYRATPKLGYPDVQSFCQDLGGAPVTIGSEEENQLMLRSLCPEGDFCYIGLLGDFTGRSYWASGEAVNYTRLVHADNALFPIWENSRSTEYRVTLLSNMPGEVSGCDVRYTFLFSGGPAPLVDVVVAYVVPVVAMIWSGVLRAQRRPRAQWLATSLLLMAFCTNLLWAAYTMAGACFVDDFHTLSHINVFGRLTVASGVAQTSFLGLWMIVRRMSVLYPSGAFKQLFWANLSSANISAVALAFFVDTQSPFAPTWPVLLAVASAGVTCLLYVVIAARAFRHLRYTWACLRDEATNGCSSQGTTLTEQVRAAKFHLLAVPLATMTGALRWAALAAISTAWIYWPELTLKRANPFFIFTMFLDTITNDFSNHVLAAMNMDEAVVRAKGVTTEVAERVEKEVEQHRLAVQMLKAAPTSTEQLQQLAILEGKAMAALGSEQEVGPFLILQSAVRVETARIHRLMQCVRLRAMTMQTRYQFLIEVPALEGAPRQHVPEEFAAGEESQARSRKYLDWLYGEANGAQQVLFQQLQHLLAKFNSTAWPSDLGLAPEEFPWRIWAGADDHKAGKKRLQKGEVISPGSTLKHSPARSSCLASAPGALCIVLEETSADHALVHRSGMLSPEQVLRDDLRSSHGGGVFIPGPQKKKQRSLAKIAADYEASAARPAAASLVDVCRCMLVCEDPYAMAVLVAYLRENMEVVRLKNRFNEDILESRAAGELQAMFYAASASDTTASETETATTVRTHSSEYRDISMNVVVKTPSGVPFVCEIQVTLSNLAILKHADQKLYTVRRMRSPLELAKARTFGEAAEANKAVMV